MCTLGDCLPTVPAPDLTPIVADLAAIILQYAGAAIERLLMGLPGLF